MPDLIAAMRNGLAVRRHVSLVLVEKEECGGGGGGVVVVPVGRRVKVSPAGVTPVQSPGRIRTPGTRTMMRLEEKMEGAAPGRQ